MTIAQISVSSEARPIGRTNTTRIVGLHAPDRVGHHERFEATAQIKATFENPFDPAQIDVTAHLRSPSGAVRSVPGFYYQSFTRELVDGREVRTPDGDPQWNVRFAPDETGTWSWWWSVKTRDGSTITLPQTLDVEPSTNGGPIRRSRHDHRYLVFEDGSPYFAIGENVAFPDARGTFAYDSWYQRLAEQRATYARVWTPPYGFGLEWSDAPLGDYTRRMDRAWQLDHVVEDAERRGIYQTISFWSQGAFSTEPGKGQWAANPYNTANGGPLAAPNEVFTDARAKELFKQRFRYSVARWGYSTSILSWELWNEVDLIDGYDSIASAVWHKEMTDYIRSIDPMKHLVTTSFSNPVYDPLVWSGAELDYTQFHHYPVGDVRDQFKDFSHAMSTWTPLAATAYQRPTLFAEFGIGPWPVSRDVDPEGIAFHDGLWAGALSGSFGTGMTWWWDLYIDARPDHFYPMFGAIQRFVDGVQWDRERFRPVAAVVRSSREIATVGLHGDTTTLVWLKDKAHQWYSHDPATIGDATMVLSGLVGQWCGAWWDTTAGAPTREVSVNGATLLEVPPFVSDVALRLERC